MKKLDINSNNGVYEIIIKENLLDELKDYLDTNRFYVIISDNQIPDIYIDKVKSVLNNNIFITFPAGEKSKSFSEYQKIIIEMQKYDIQKDACIIALGGGVTGDLAGFVASTYMRGIDYIQIPTTLLAQIDSSVGGKVAINTDLAKNSIGNFYPPKKVLIDYKTLDTLSSRQFNNGMSEMIKYGMIYSEDFFLKILNSDIKENLEYFIYESINIKKHFVESDEFDNGIRQILNYGHTYGHAYEAYYKYEKYLHGEAISLGMVKVCDNIELKKQLILSLEKFDLPTFDPVKDESLYFYIKKDKKYRNNQLNLIIVNEIGKAEIKETLL